jgi:acyl-CoA thioesterase
VTGDHSLDAATALQPVGAGQYGMELDEGWWLDGSAFGGYLAAGLYRATAEALTNPAQRPLSITIQFNAPTRPGSALISVQTIRAGSSVSSMLATLEQDGAVNAIALSCFGRVRGGPVIPARPLQVPPPDQCPPLTVRPDVRARFPLAERFERCRLPAPAAGTDTGGWIRFSAPRRIDALAVLVLLDSWTVAASAKTRIERMLTLSYFVQFLAPIPHGDPGDFSLVTFSCDAAQDGYAEDVGEMRDATGSVLARSRQVVLIAK